MSTQAMDAYHTTTEHGERVVVVCPGGETSPLHPDDAEEWAIEILRAVNRARDVADDDAPAVHGRKVGGQTRPCVPSPEHPCQHEPPCLPDDRWDAEQHTTEDDGGRPMTTDIQARAREIAAGHYPRCSTVTGKVNDRPCRACRAALQHAEEYADGIDQPFCACGRRVSQCDGSRRGCTKGGGRAVAAILAEGGAP